MAREHAKNLFSMWTDDDFTTQPWLDKLLYNVLLAQPSLNYAGVLPINLKRWRKALRDGDRTPTELEVKAALVRMERRRYVYTDDDTGEALIRTLIRNDGIDRLPNVLLSALRSISAVESPKLAFVLFSELKKITLPDVKGDSPAATRTRESLKRLMKDAVTHLETLTKGLSEPLPEPFLEEFPEGLSEGLPEPFQRPGETEPFPKGLPEPFREPPVVVEVEVAKSPLVGTHLGRARARTAETGPSQPNPPRNEPPPMFCPKHMPDGTDDDCGACGGYRRARKRWDDQHANDHTDMLAVFWAEVRACSDCDERGLIDHGNRVTKCPLQDWEYVNS